MTDLETSLYEDIETFKEKERKQKIKDYQYAIDECIDTDKYYKLSDIMDIGFSRAPRGFKQRKKGYLKGSTIIRNLKKEINKIKKYEKLKSEY